jgi:hypothetical protein
MRPAPERQPFTRPLALRGWSVDSAWGYDPVLECYWADLRPAALPPHAAAEAPPRLEPVVIGPEHLISTVTGLARAVAFAAQVGDRDVYLALTA